MSVELHTRIGPGSHIITTPTFEQMFFPAGEAHVKVINENTGKGELTEVAIVRTPNANDLMMVGMWADAAQQRGSRTVLLMPYLPGARQDRGLPWGAAVYASFLNVMQIDQIIAFDVHSEAMEGLVDNLTVVSSAPLIRKFVVGRADSDEHEQNYAGIIAPDKGAVARAQTVATACHLPLYKAEKHRDESTGKLSGFTCEPLPKAEKPYLIVDDICDGGGTFMGLAEATGLAPEDVHLYVSHGVFSKGSVRLGQHFGKVITTNSYYPQSALQNLTYIDVVPYLIGAIK